MKGALQGACKTIPFLEIERCEEGSLCLAAFKNEFWEGPGA